jgi:predicted pyridoxine 5'-phosphate oxidase superfamily flavin-nucleotide-binding protein
VGAITITDILRYERLSILEDLLTFETLARITISEVFRQVSRLLAGKRLIPALQLRG